MTELSIYLTQITGYSESTVNAVIEGFQKYVQMSIRKGNLVELEKFGKFGFKDLQERSGRNPKTGEAIVIKPKRRPNFKFSGVFVNSIQPEPGTIEPLAIPVEPDEPAVETNSQILTPPPVPESLLSSQKWFVSLNGQTTPVLEKDLPKVVKPETPIWSEQTGWNLAKNTPALGYLFVGVN